MRAAIAHDWLVRYAGSERVVEQLLIAFPGSRLLTTVVEGRALPAAFGSAEPSWLDRLPGTHTHHEWFLGLMPLAWRLRRPVTDVDVVIASSHACANAVRTAPGIPLVSYCHTPMRYAWNFEAERGRFPRPVRPVARIGMGAFRHWDRRTARRVTHFVANSAAVAARIRDSYHVDAEIVHPPVDTEFFTPAGMQRERFLYVGRLTGYKRPDLVVAAFEGLPYELDVVGDGADLQRLRASAGPNIHFRGTVDRAELRELYRSAVALVYPIDEDFGIAMAEAQACGAPVIGLAAGGALDIVIPGTTGVLVGSQDQRELRSAIEEVAGADFVETDIRTSAERFSEHRFREAMREVAARTIRARS